MRRGADHWVLTIALSLSILGLLMVFSASLVTTASSTDYGNDPYFFLKRQLIFMAVGLVALAAARRVNLDLLRPWLSLPLVGVTVGLLILVLLIGPEINGAHRWIDFGPFQFQPSELAKLAIIFYMADFLARRGEKIESFLRVIPALGIFGIVLVLVEQEPDLGTALVIAGVFMGMLFMAGGRVIHLAAMASAGLMVVVVGILAKPYRMARITAFLDPMAKPLDEGYQAIQSLIAVGSGGLFGRGFGIGHQKFKYLPEAHTDYIFAILSEELGLIGGVAVLVLFVTLLYKGFKIGVNCRRPYLRFLAAGITFQLALQALLNIGVVTGSLPSTGIPLPFISYGGTSLLFSLLAVGLLLNISDHNARQSEEGRKKPRRSNKKTRRGSTLTSSSNESQEPVSSGAWEREAAGARLKRSRSGPIPRPAVEPTLLMKASTPKPSAERRSRERKVLEKRANRLS